MRLIPAQLSRVFLVWVAGLLLFPCEPATSASPDPEELLQKLNNNPHARPIAISSADVVDHEIGLGAMQKVRGEWRFKHSERLSGKLSRYTFQIVDGFAATEVMDELMDSLAKAGGASELFACDGRACGQGAQWANRVFNQQVLYGREDLQRYRVYAIQGDTAYRLVIYSAERTEDRQYLHVDVLRIAN